MNTGLKSMLKEYSEFFSKKTDLELQISELKKDLKEVKEEMAHLEKYFADPEAQHQTSLPFGGDGDV